MHPGAVICNYVPLKLTSPVLLKRIHQPADEYPKSTQPKIAAVGSKALIIGRCSLIICHPVKSFRVISEISNRVTSRDGPAFLLS